MARTEGTDQLVLQRLRRVHRPHQCRLAQGRTADGSELLLGQGKLLGMYPSTRSPDGRLQRGKTG